MITKSKDEVIKQAYDKGHEYLITTNAGCCEAMELTLQEIFHLHDDNVFKDLFKAGSGFIGGIGVMNDVCGALLGGCMMLSSKICGRTPGEISKCDSLDAHISAELCSVERLMPIGKYFKWFEKEFGSIKCREITTKFLGVYYNAQIPWQMQLALEAGLGTYCTDLVGKATAKIAEMLWDAIEAEKKEAEKP